MKVLFYTPLPDAKAKIAGGISVSSKSLRENNEMLLSNNLDVDFFNTQKPNSNQERSGKVNFNNIKYFFIIKNRLKKQIKSKEYDVLHICTSTKIALLKDLLVVKSVRKIFKGQIIIHIRFADLDQIVFKNKWINSIILKLINKNVDKLLLLSKNLIGELADFGVPREKLFVLYNFQNSIVNYNFDKDTSGIVKILFLGFLGKRKGILDLLDAALKIQDKDFNLDICGVYESTEVEKKVSEIIEKNPQLKSKVTFKGFVAGKSKVDLLTKADIFVLPTYGEGLPISIIEAMGAGCAVVSTTVGAIPEIVDEGNGFVLKPGDVDQIAASFSKLIDDRDSLTSMQKNSYEKGKQYSIDKYIKKLADFYNAK